MKPVKPFEILVRSGDPVMEPLKCMPMFWDGVGNGGGGTPIEPVDDRGNRINWDYVGMTFSKPFRIIIER